jgi:hypothetical protein
MDRMGMRKRMKDWLQHKVVSLHARNVERGGWGHRVGRPVVVVYMANVILFQVIRGTQAIPTDLMPTFIVVFVAVQLVLGTVLTATTIKAYGRPSSTYIIGLMIVIVVMAVVLSLLTYQGVS